MSPDLEMNGKYLDLFTRSLCPKCDAYNNWEVHEDEYICLSCNGKYRYTDGKLFNLSGDAINNKEREYIESHPYYKILSEIDIQNRGYWFDVFSKFDETEKYRKWNWPSFFFGTLRYFWKGLWKKGLIIIGIYYIAILSFVSINVLFKQNIENQQIHFFYFNILIELAIKIYLGYFGSEDYFKFVKNLGEDVVRAKKERKIGRILFFVMLILSFINSILLG